MMKQNLILKDKQYKKFFKFFKFCKFFTNNKNHSFVV